MSSTSLASSSVPAASWQDFITTRNKVSYNTVDRLKQIISRLNSSLYTSIAKSGKKQDHIDRIVSYLDQVRATNDLAKYGIAKQIIDYPYGDPREPPPPVPVPRLPPYNTVGGYGAAVMASAAASSSAYSRPPAVPQAPSRVTSTTAPTKPFIRFKLSPFFLVTSQIGDVASTNETISATERGTGTLRFKLTDAERVKIATPRYQLRLYCTSSTFHSPNAPHMWGTRLCPIEFPLICELRLNGEVINANTRGMKKKPGTAPPVDLTKLVRADNTISVTYLNNMTPFVGKKYYLVVNIVEVSTVDELVARLRSRRTRSAAEVKDDLYGNSKQDDDDIIAGSSTISLKCPLSYMRIATPARSQACTHARCFDAGSWYSMMEQTTTWSCPVCEKEINYEELIMDGYFEEILKTTPESVEDIMIEPDGAWHSSDGKYHSAGWVAPPPSARPAITAAKVERSSTPANASYHIDNANTVYLIDTDDEDDEQVIRTTAVDVPSSSRPPILSTRSGTVGASAVIDLTLDSDDEDVPSPAPLSASTSAPTTAWSTSGSLPPFDKGKRKASDDDIGGPEKRARTNEVSPVSSNRPLNGANGAARSYGVDSLYLPPPPPSAYYTEAPAVPGLPQAPNGLGLNSLWPGTYGQPIAPYGLPVPVGSAARPQPQHLPQPPQPQAYQQGPHASYHHYAPAIHTYSHPYNYFTPYPYPVGPATHNAITYYPSHYHYSTLPAPITYPYSYYPLR